MELGAPPGEPSAKKDMQNSKWKKNITLFLTSQAVTMFGSSLVQYAITWYVAKETGSGIMFSLMTLCGFLPQVLVSVFAGVWADRFNRKRMIILADAGIAVSTLILVFIVAKTENFFGWLLLISAIRSVGSGIQMPAVNALIPQLVPQEKLMRVGGINGSVFSMVNLVAPAVAGAMLSWGSIGRVMLIDVATAIVGISIFLLVPVAKLPKAHERQKGGYFDDLKAGIHYSFTNSFLRRTLLICTIYCFFITPAALLNVLFVTRVFGESYWYLTLNEISFFVGAFLGGLILGAWGGFRNRLKTLAWGGFVFGLTTIAFGIVDVFWIYLAIMFITGLVMPFGNSPLMVMIQEKVDTQMQGRVFSLMQIVTTLIMPIGMALFGPLADIIPIQWIMIGSGIGLVVLALAIIGWKSYYLEGVSSLSPKQSTAE